MEIKKAQFSEIELLRDFAEWTFRAAYEAENEAEAFDDYCRDAFSMEKFREEMSDTGSAFWMGWVEGQVAAYLKLNFDTHTESLPSGKTVQVERIYINPAWQGRGLGAKLLAFTEEHAVSMGAEWIWLSVWKQNPRAVKFYESCGYEISGTEIFQLGDDPQEDWVMRKRV